jgi:hypothetical protein
LRADARVHVLRQATEAGPDADTDADAIIGDLEPIVAKSN